MTFREKLQQEHPEYVSDAFIAGCFDCPSTHGYEERFAEFLICVASASENEERCRVCWNREIPEKSKENDMKKILETKNNEPMPEVAEELNRTFNEGFDALKRRYAKSAQTCWLAFNSLIDVGFTREEALELLIADISEFKIAI